MEQQHYFPPLHGAVDCEKCEVRDCWCRGKFQRNRRDMPHTSGRCPRLPDLCGFVEKEERELYKATFMLVHAEYGVGGLHLTLTIPGHKRNRKGHPFQHISQFHPLLCRPFRSDALLEPVFPIGEEKPQQDQNDDAR